MSISFLHVLINPNRFFQERVQRTENLKVPILIVLVNGILAAVAAYMMAGLTMQLMPAEMQTYASIASAFGAIAGLIGSFLIWLIITAIFFAISVLFKGRGDFRRTLEYIGYGFLPQALGAFISLFLIYQFVSTAQVVPVTDPMQIQAAALQLMGSPLLLLSSVIGMLLLIWGANIWIFGMKHARALSARDAALTVGVPVVLYLAYSIYSLGVF
jgi:hypothetical protein